MVALIYTAFQDARSLECAIAVAIACSLRVRVQSLVSLDTARWNAYGDIMRK